MCSRRDGYPAGLCELRGVQQPRPSNRLNLVHTGNKGFNSGPQVLGGSKSYPVSFTCILFILEAWPQLRLFMPSSTGELTPSIPTGLSVSQRLTLHLYKAFYLFLILAALGLRCCTQAFPSCGECGLLFAVAPLWSTGSRYMASASRLQGSAAAPGASCPVVRGIFPDQGLNSVS